MADVVSSAPPSFVPTPTAIPDIDSPMEMSTSSLNHESPPAATTTRASSADLGHTFESSAPMSRASSTLGPHETPPDLGLGVAQPLTARKGPQSFFSGSKIKHLKKPDGVPLWRVDIQYEFLQGVFNDKTRVFTNTYTGEKSQTFADIYVDAMARSSKTSKILRDKLMNEKDNAQNMAMVCLLVNVGRMNTTLNFFPEMKAQLRTYHAIPVLQYGAESSAAYKQLQDAPRLKSILKGACEDREEPHTLKEISEKPVPRTNPINLIFILSTYAPQTSELHFPENMDFYDLITRQSLSSKSRALAFLWLMWHYLESSFSEQECLNNPFGRGRPAIKGNRSWCVPEFEYLTEEQAALENIDPPEELNFGNTMQEERRKHNNDYGLMGGSIGRGRGGRKGLLGEDESPAGSPPLQGIRGSKIRQLDYGLDYMDTSDSRTRSGSPEGVLQTPANGKLKRIILKSGGKQLAGPDAGHMFTANRSIGGSTPNAERSGGRQRSSHSLQMEKNRQDHISNFISVKVQGLDKKRKRTRLREHPIARAWKRLKCMEDPLIDSDSESAPRVEESTTKIKSEDTGDEYLPAPKKSKLERSGGYKIVSPADLRGPAGIVPSVVEIREGEDDYGEEALTLAVALRRCERRVERWESNEQQRTLSGIPVQPDADKTTSGEQDEPPSAVDSPAPLLAANNIPHYPHPAPEIEVESDDDTEMD